MTFLLIIAIIFIRPFIYVPLVYLADYTERKKECPDVTRVLKRKDSEFFEISGIAFVPLFGEMLFIISIWFIVSASIDLIKQGRRVKKEISAKCQKAFEKFYDPVYDFRKEYREKGEIEFLNEFLKSSKSKHYKKFSKKILNGDEKFLTKTYKEV